MNNIKDIYDLEVERLTEEYKEHPGCISNAWGMGSQHSPLFDYIGDIQGHAYVGHKHINAGCLTMIRMNSYFGAFINGKYDEELTLQIRNDERIPTDEDSITTEHLPVFAEWQRKIQQLQKNS